MLEGASWDDKQGVLDSCKPKQLLSSMPVILIKAALAEKEPKEDVYPCPVYFTERRFQEEVFTAHLRTKRVPAMWITAGVCMILDSPMT